MPPDVVDLSKYNQKSSVMRECLHLNQLWMGTAMKYWGFLYSWIRNSALCCCFTVCLYCFCLFIQIVLHCESSVNLPLSVLLEKYCEALSARTNVTGIYFSISQWLLVTPGSVFSVLAPGTSFPAEINLVLPAFSFHWQQRTVVWHGKKTLKFAHLERTSGGLILAAFFHDLIC